MIQALRTAISGLSSQQQALNNESNNVANVNTIGYKTSRVSFADQMYQNNLGKGTQILGIEKLYTQGNLKLTGANYDMALDGDGFFIVSNKSSAGTAQSFYTRAGNFRMGNNGTLQDISGNEVQGWMMIPSKTQVFSTNPNLTKFTDNFTNLISSRIIKHSNYIQTITAKTSDYQEIAKSDSSIVFSGDGTKTKSSKISDINEAIKDYTSWLQILENNPDATSSSSVAQISQINFKSGKDSIIGQNGDQIYVYIDGNKYSQSFLLTYSSQKFRQELWDSLSPTDRISEGLTDPSTLISVPSPMTLSYKSAIEAYDKAAGKIATYKALADQISQITGLDATMAIDSSKSDVFNTNESYSASTNLADMLKGIIQIKALIPGKEFKITEVGEISSQLVNQGRYQTTANASIGSGIGALNSSKDALSKLITGKQQDVYTVTDLNLKSSPMFQYSIKIYDKNLDRVVSVPYDTPLFIDATDSNGNFTVDEFVKKFNEAGALTNPHLTDYVVARNVNDNLVIQTLDSNYDVEFSGNMKQLPTMKINLNELVDNSVYTFNLNVNGNSYPLTVDYSTADTIEQEIAYEDIQNQIQTQLNSINASNPTFQFGVTPQLNGSFSIYTKNENINFDNVVASVSDVIPTVSSSLVNAGILTTMDSTKIVVSPSLISTASESGLVGNTGIVRVNFSWNENIDLDPVVVDPNGDAMGFLASWPEGDINSNPQTTNTGGYWDVDDMGGVAPNQENFYWATTAPTGDYNFYVRNYSNSWPNGTPIDVTVTIKTGDNVEVRTISIPVNTRDIGPFTFNYDGSGSTATSTSNSTFSTTIPYNFTIKDTTNSTTLANITYTPTSTQASDPALFYAGLLDEIKNTQAYQDGLISATSDETGVDILNHNLVFSSVDNSIDFTTTQGLDGVAKEVKYTIDTSDDKSKSVFTLTINDKVFTYKTDETPTSDEIRNEFISQIQADTTLNGLVEISGSGDEIIIKNKDTLASGYQNFISSFTNASITKPNDGYPTVTTSSSILRLVDKNSNYSGREGAGAEFIELRTEVDQEASKGSLQLRLDTLGISDSAFGEFAVDNTGLITMKQDGAEFAIGQVAIAQFTNNEGLEAIGNNLLSKTIKSGNPIYNINNNKTAQIQSKTLELSNADLSESLVNLMIFQRAFEANAKSITTSNDLLSTIINLRK